MYVAASLPTSIAQWIWGSLHRMERSKQTSRFQLYITVDDFLAFLLPSFDVPVVLPYVAPSIRVESTCCCS